MSVRTHIFQALFIFYVCLFIFLFTNGFLLGDATFWIGICLIPLILISAQNQNRTLRFLPVVMFCFVGCFFIKAQSFRYLFILVSLIFLIESLRAKVSPLLLWILLIISPLFRYLSEVFTFPIRLKLSEWTGLLLTSAGFPVQISGNIIHLNDSDFSVDPACMGLQMMGFSFLTGIFLIIHYQRITRKELPLRYMIAIMTIIFGLNIVSNLMRILILVIFKIPAQNPIHDLPGIISLILYVWLPVSFLVKYLFKNHALNVKENSGNPLEIRPLMIIGNVVILFACTYFTIEKPAPHIGYNTNVAKKADEKYIVNELDNGITQFRSDKALIYSKKIPTFYSAEHSPYICWKGSGYTFTSVEEKTVAGALIYYGTLQKGKEQFQTAWWFSNKRHNTISQLDWRWRVLCGEPNFQLINVTATSQDNLKEAIEEWL